jgi:phosphopantothenoylcysteine decarboxylase/phosphopantothenate--cysteine ligase
MAAAVCDYRPLKRLARKMKKGRADILIRMGRTRDILADLGRRKGKMILVGFAAETGDPVAEAKRKLARKNLDMVVANNVSREDSGFGSDFNRVAVVYRDGTVNNLPRMRKDRLARIIVRRCLGMI